ncbi:hypothetical protein FHX81_3481 [Saccharothrix saharensis]|uniref:Uncharacterized protein n=1 Tax=Saccharothrix saharensis TaxID=571190 RepID=A0A543JE81_9PSEU|nr:hypothetical protein [Saccharothrix saharensis]TQM81120.1 hypothetical protein FHX81_3481 [Saccharothrix saharensis]
MVGANRLVLRGIAPSDVDDVARSPAEPRVMRYIEDGRPVSRDDVERVVLPEGASALVGHARAVNAGSRRVPEKVGPRHVRTFHEEWPEYVEGAEHGDVEYALDLHSDTSEGISGALRNTEPK